MLLSLSIRRIVSIIKQSLLSLIASLFPIVSSFRSG
jgi:hypothetical protein